MSEKQSEEQIPQQGNDFEEHMEAHESEHNQENTGDILMDDEKMVLKEDSENLMTFLQKLSAKLEEENKIENKIAALKGIHQKIQQSKIDQSISDYLCKWISKTKLLEKHLHDDSHVQVLRKMPLIVKFMYEQNQLNDKWIQQFMLSGLLSHDEYLRVVLFLIRFLKIEDLKSLFKLLRNTSVHENSHVAQMFLAIINNKYFFEESAQKASQAKQESILKQIYTEEQAKEPQLKEQEKIHEIEIENLQNFPEDLSFGQIKHLSNQLLEFLVELLESNIPLYSPILNKLISSKYHILSVTLVHLIVDLFKNKKNHYLWILEHCLRIDFRQVSKEKSVKNAVKTNFIQKLTNEGVYQYTIATLARNRFNKQIVEKGLTVLILLSKNFKPLQKVYTQYIWKVLGLNSRDEKERQQFFSFVRDSLRNQKSFTQESVDYIYFQILMKMSYKWFSLKIFECLQLLFMRLNEDLKYVAYSNQSYTICNPDLIGLEKFWYIYFHTNDCKVSKKSKQFLWKLATYSSSYQIKYQLYQRYMNRILRCMAESSPEQKQQLTAKGFEIIERLLQDNQKKETGSQYLQLNIRNETSEAVPPKTISITISEKSCLSHLREQISQSISPSLNKIKLLLRGQFLKGEKMTLKELSVHTGQTIMVINEEMDQETLDRQKELVKQNTKQLIQIFGSELNPKLLTFICEKMEGQNIQKIMNSIMDEEKMITFKEQFAQLEKKGEIGDKKVNALDEFIAQEGANNENQVFSFSVMLSEESQNVKMLLQCAQQSFYISGWETIKKIPLCKQEIQKTKYLAENSDWHQIFPKGQQEQMYCIYQSYIMKSLFKTEDQIQEYMIRKQGLLYLMEWLSEVLTSKNTTFIEAITDLIRISLFSYSSVDRFRRRNKEKVFNCQLLSQLIEQSYIEELHGQLEKVVDEMHEEDLNKILEMLVDEAYTKQNNEVLSSNLVQLCIFFIDKLKTAGSNILDLSSQQLFRLLMLNGYSGQYLVLYSVAHGLDEQQSIRQKIILSQLQKLQNKLFEESNFHSNNFQALYSYSSCLLSCICPSQFDIQNRIIKKSIKFLQINSEMLDAIRFVGVLQVLNICINNLYHTNSITNTELENKIVELTPWIFDRILFSLANPHPLIREKGIRKKCYEILDVITNYEEGLMFIICQSIINIGIEARSKDQDYLDFKKADYLGLTNLGATCYINSLLQQVYHTKFSKLILQTSQKMMMSEEMEMEGSESGKIGELKKVFMRLHCSIKNVVNPKKFIDSISFYGEPINTSVQQDATQFLLCLFDFIESEGYRNEIYEVFGGNLCNEITAGDENNVFIKNNIEHFNSIGIDIKGKKNLQEAFAYFIKPQNLDGENMYYCEQLGKKTKATKRTFIENMPNILVITLKRFEFDYETQSRSKLNDYFEFPFQLDMHKYSASYLRDKKETSDSKYKLSGILVHSGSAESGHYYSFIKVGQKWYEFNDKHVAEFNINNLKNECFGCAQGKKSHNAYMLFYEKNESGFHGVFLNQIDQANKLKCQIQEENAIFLKNRLIYDENFIAFVKSMYLKSMDERLFSIQDILDGKKPQADPVVHFDLNNSFGPFVSDEVRAGGTVDDIEQFDPHLGF